MACLLAAGALSVAGGPQPYSVREILSKSGALAAKTQTIRTPELSPGKIYSLMFSIDSPASLQPESRVEVTISDGQTRLATKTLHLGDPDFYVPVHVDRATHAEVRITATASGDAHYSLRVNEWPDSTHLSRGVNHRLQDASPMTLGETVHASADTVDYIPIPGTPRRDAIEGEAGEDWYRFHFDGRAPKLIFFQVELMDRDDLPVDVSVFRIENGNPVMFTDGQDPVALPHEVQALPGNKFAPRILSEAGDYYLRVRANHPEYRLVTHLYDPPP